MRTGFHYENVAILRGQVNFAVGRDWRPAETRSLMRNALAVDFRAGREAVAIEDAGIAQHVERAVIDEGSRHVRAALLLLPRHPARIAGDIAGSSGANGEDGSFRPAAAGHHDEA